MNNLLKRSFKLLDSSRMGAKSKYLSSIHTSSSSFNSSKHSPINDEAFGLTDLQQSVFMIFVFFIIVLKYIRGHVLAFFTSL